MCLPREAYHLTVPPDIVSTSLSPHFAIYLGFDLSSNVPSQSHTSFLQLKG